MATRYPTARNLSRRSLGEGGRLCRYLLRCPLSLSRIHWLPGAKTLFYEGKSAHHDPLASHPQGETLDILEFLARVLTQIPEPRTHGVRYFGAYSSKARAYRKKANFTLESLGGPKDSNIQDDNSTGADVRLLERLNCT